MVNTEKSENLPWVEKYRPQCMDDMISHKEITRTVDRFIREEHLPHLLFYGPPGTGKTTTCLAIAKQLYSPQEFNSCVLELNASDERGINVVREQIYNFASTRMIFRQGFKLVILDEADAMTKDAQNALRRIIEKFTDNARFCLIGNYLSKIIPALQSRCTRFRFAPIAPALMVPRLRRIIEFENLSVADSGMEAIVRLARGDMRRALNIMQSASMAFESIDEQSVYTCVGHPLRSDIKAIVLQLLNDPFADAYRGIADIRTGRGLALQDILTEVSEYMARVEVPCDARIELLSRLADLEQRISLGTNEKIQLCSLISIFFDVRHLICQAAKED